MADLRPQYTDEAVGANHPTKTDVINRAYNVEHDEDGTHTGDKIVKGWIQFDGTGVIAIQDSFNVSGIVDNGVGDYTITWDTDFANNDYSVVALSNSLHNVVISITTTLTRVRTYDNNHNLEDSAFVNLIAIGDQ